MRAILTFAIVFMLVQATFGQANYDVAKIPTELKQNADAVIRNETQFLTVKDIKSAQLNYKIAITIFNQAANYLSKMEEIYDPFSNIYNIKAAIYDADGKKIKDYKSSDIKDQSLLSSFSIYDDNRVKRLDFVHNSYPYTIEYSYSQDYKGIIAFPNWSDLRAFNLAVEQTSYTIEKNKNYQLHYLTSAKIKTDSIVSGDKIQYKWSSNNVPAIAVEPLSTGFKKLSAWVKVSPNQFEYDGTNGNFSDWKNFGLWIYNLNTGGDKLPESTKNMVHDLIKDAKTDREKISILYNHLQQNTRYVSVQLGVGGFRPILAEKVAQVNYGDCKALSNYMKALLGEAGINANLIVIGNGMPSLNKKFSSMGQANHMILCVPSAKDTLFLECTSQHYPMGFIGNDNADRDVLMVTKDGGKIIHTPVYQAKENFQIRKTKIDLTDDGSGLVILNTSYGNEQFNDNLAFTLMEPTELRKKILETSKLPIASLDNFKYTRPDKNKPILNEEISFKTGPILSTGGDRFFLVLNQINRKESVPAKIENRKTPFEIPYGYHDWDEITYTLPKGYGVEFLPAEVNISSEFGTYKASFKAVDNNIVYTRNYTVQDDTYSPEKYNDYVDFCKKIYQADKQKAVLAKK